MAQYRVREEYFLKIPRHSADVIYGLFNERLLYLFSLYITEVVTASIFEEGASRHIAEARYRADRRFSDNRGAIEPAS